MHILITGSSGLIGSACVEHFCVQGHTVVGIDNNERGQFFGPEADTAWNRNRLRNRWANFHPNTTDVADYQHMEKHFTTPYDAIIHCAAQPSHDKSREIPLRDFCINALGTANLLELTRVHSPAAVFVFLSTNKVYGDRPNTPRGFRFTEYPTRWDGPLAFPDFPTHSANWPGFDETLSIDQCLHSIFGASKAGADLLVQEYGRYLGVKTISLRCGCLTGPAHSSAALHGFLAYLMKCIVASTPYTIYGYEGKQVRDNLHSSDVARAISLLIENPPPPGTVYNMGGGRENSCSILEAIAMAEELTGKKASLSYDPTPRTGDHICYISDTSKFRDAYLWEVCVPLSTILIELWGAQNRGSTTERYIPGDGGEEYFQSYMEWLLPRVKGAVLDIGCGHGWGTAMYGASPLTTAVVGTDSASLYHERHEKVSYARIATEVMISSPPILPFDTVVATEHIEHIEDPHPLLQWIRTTGATFLGSMPNPDDENNPDPYHKRTFTPAQWEEILRTYWERVNVHPTSHGYVWEASNGG